MNIKLLSQKNTRTYRFVKNLSTTIIRVQCRARNPNPTTVAATRPKRRRVAATVVGLGFLDTAL